jgi:hypothetical protein
MLSCSHISRTTRARREKRRTAATRRAHLAIASQENCRTYIHTRPHPSLHVVCHRWSLSYLASHRVATMSIDQSPGLAAVEFATHVGRVGQPRPFMWRIRDSFGVSAVSVVHDNYLPDRPPMAGRRTQWKHARTHSSGSRPVRP